MQYQQTAPYPIDGRGRIRYGVIIRHHWNGKREPLFLDVPESLAEEWLAGPDAQRDTMPREDWDNLDDRYTFDAFTAERWAMPPAGAAQRRTIKSYRA